MTSQSNSTHSQLDSRRNELDQHEDAASGTTERSAMSSFMMLCCIAMLVAFGAFVFMAPANQSWTQTALSAAPLLACLGAHLVMHRFMGRSCHSKKEDN